MDQRIADAACRMNRCGYLIVTWGLGYMFCWLGLLISSVVSLNNLDSAVSPLWSIFWLIATSFARTAYRQIGEESEAAVHDFKIATKKS